jgi:hypothetical protein
LSVVPKRLNFAAFSEDLYDYFVLLHSGDEHEHTRCVYEVTRMIFIATYLYAYPNDAATVGNIFGVPVVD